MNKKKITILACTLFMVMSLGACGKAKEDEFTVTQQESESVDSEINNDENTESEDSQINKDENTESKDSGIKKRGRHRYREFIHKTAAKQYAEG